MDLSILGILSISSEVTAKDVWTLADFVPTTVTSSISLSEANATDSFAVSETDRYTSLIVSVAYPTFETVILYGPPGLKLPTENTPFASEDDVLVMPVGICVTSTVADPTFDCPLRAEVVSLAAKIFALKSDNKKKPEKRYLV
jgi:hypothetical protein